MTYIYSAVSLIKKKIANEFKRKNNTWITHDWYKTNGLWFNKFWKSKLLFHLKDFIKVVFEHNLCDLKCSGRAFENHSLKDFEYEIFFFFFKVISIKFSVFK